MCNPKNGDLLFQYCPLVSLQDWWNSNSYADYYRTWNVVVHDWLYAYIYKDLYRVGIFLFINYMELTPPTKPHFAFNFLCEVTLVT